MPGDAQPPRGGERTTAPRPDPRPRGQNDAPAPPPANNAAPRVLFPSGAAAPPSPAPNGARKSPAVKFGAPAPRQPRGLGPRVLVDGSVRRRIPCGAGDLLLLDGGAPPAVVEEALRLVRGVNLDDAHFDDVLRFGGDLQTGHAAITETALTMANDPALKRGQSALLELIDLITSLDPAKIFPQRKPSFATAFGDFLDPQRPPDALFDERYPRIVQKAQEIGALESDLRALSQRLHALDRRYTELARRVAAFVLAARFLIGYIRDLAASGAMAPHYGSQADALEGRIISLLATRTTAEAGRLTNWALQQSVQTLLDAGRGMLAEDLPAFRTAYTAALSAAVAPASGHEVHARLVQRLSGGTP